MGHLGRLGDLVIVTDGSRGAAATAVRGLRDLVQAPPHVRRRTASLQLLLRVLGAMRPSASGVARTDFAEGVEEHAQYGLFQGTGSNHGVDRPD